MQKSYFQIYRIVLSKSVVEVYTHELAEFQGLERQQFIDNFISNYRPVLQHTCVNKYGKTFESCMQHTSIAHFFEHAVIQELVNHDRPSSDFKFYGYTKPIKKVARPYLGSCDDKNVARPYLNYCITLNYRSDIETLSAIKAAKARFDKLLA